MDKTPQPWPMDFKVTITAGRRSYSEIVDRLEELIRFDERMKECYDDEDSDRPYSFAQYTRPVEVVGDDGLNQVNGNHFLFGFIESIAQSDRSPFFSLEEGNPDKTPWRYSVYHVPGYKP